MYQTNKTSIKLFPNIWFLFKVHGIGWEFHSRNSKIQWRQTSLVHLHWHGLRMGDNGTRSLENWNFPKDFWSLCTRFKTLWYRFVLSGHHRRSKHIWWYRSQRKCHFSYSDSFDRCTVFNGNLPRPICRTFIRRSWWVLF